MAGVFNQLSEQPRPGRSFDALIDLLREEETIYAKMGTLLDEEQAAMLALDGERVSNAAACKETLALRIKGLDESRRVLARRLAVECGLAPDSVTITRLCERADPGVALQLRDAGGRLRSVVEKCREKNDCNARAAASGLELLGGAIDALIAQADPMGKVYSKGKGTRAAGSGYAALSKTAGSGLISRRA